jgi:hypothetical protein
LSDTLGQIFEDHCRFVNIDDFAYRVGNLPNINLISLFDCCREKPATKSSIGAPPPEAKEKGMSCTFYAKGDGQLAEAGGKYDTLSPTTSAWLYFIKANPGASYPAILNSFQFSVLKKCDNKVNSTRGIIFVEPEPKPWSSEDFINEGLANIVRDHSSDSEFTDKLINKISMKEEIKKVLIDGYTA